MAEYYKKQSVTKNNAGTMQRGSYTRKASANQSSSNNTNKSKETASQSTTTNTGTTLAPSTGKIGVTRRGADLQNSFSFQRAQQTTKGVLDALYTDLQNSYTAAYNGLQSGNVRTQEQLAGVKTVLDAVHSNLQTLKRLQTGMGIRAPIQIGLDIDRVQGGYEDMMKDYARLAQTLEPMTQGLQQNPLVPAMGRQALTTDPATGVTTLARRGTLSGVDVTAAQEERQRQAELAKNPLNAVQGSRLGNMLLGAYNNFASGLANTFTQGVSRASGGMTEKDISNAQEQIQRFEQMKSEFQADVAAGRKEADPARLAWYDEQIGKIRDNIAQWSEQEERTREFVHDVNAGADLLAEASSRQKAASTEGLGWVGTQLVNAGTTTIESGLDFLASGFGAIPATAPMAIRVFGNAAGEARQNGASESEQLYQGTKQAAVEWVTEHLFAGNPFYDEGGGALTDAVYNGLYKAFGEETMERVFSSMAAKIAKVPLSMAGEGIEEVLSDYMNPLADRLANAIDGAGRDVNMPDWSTVRDDFVVGALSGGLGQLSQAGTRAAAQEIRDQSTGRTILQNDGTDALRDVARYVGQDVNIGRETARNVGRAFHEVQDAYTSRAVQNRLTVLGAESDATTAEAIVRMAEDKGLTREQQLAYFGNPAARQVMEEYRQASQGNVTEDNFWAYDAQIRAEDIATEMEEADAEETETAPEEAPERMDTAIRDRERTALTEAAKITDDAELVQTFGKRYAEVTQGLHQAQINRELDAAMAYADVLQDLDEVMKLANERERIPERAEIIRNYINERYGGIDNGGEENGRAAVSDAAGRRDAGMGAGVEAGRVRPVGYGADGQTSQVRGGNGRVFDVEVRQTPAELNIPGGSETEAVGVVAERSWTEGMKNAAEEARRLGYDVTYVTGQIEVRTPANRTRRVNGVAYGDRIVVQADSRLYTPEQLTEHEVFHTRVQSDPALMTDLKERFVQEHSAEEMLDIVTRYAQIFDFCYGEETEGMTSDEIEALYDMYLEEYFADAAAEINRASMGARGASRDTSSTREVIAEREGMGNGSGGIPGVRYAKDESDTSVVVESGPSAIDREGRSVAKDLAESIPRLSDMDAVDELTGREMNDRTKKPSEQIRDLFRRIGERVTRRGFGIVHLGDYGVNGVINHKPLNRAKMITLEAVPSVIRDGRIIRETDNWKGRGYRSYIIAAPVEVAGRRLYVAAVVNETNGHQFYLNECVDSDGNYVRIREEPSDNTKTGFTVQDGVTRGPEGPSDTSISENAENSNTEITGLRSRFADLTEADRQATAQAERDARYSVAEAEAEVSEIDARERDTAAEEAAIRNMSPTELRRAVNEDRADIAAWEKLEKMGYLTDEARGMMERTRARLEREQMILRETERKVREERKAAQQRAEARQRPAQTRSDFIKRSLDLFSVQPGQRTEIGNMLGQAFDDARSRGVFSETDRSRLFDKMLEAGAVSAEADPAYRNIRDSLSGTRIFVPLEIRENFGDDYPALMREAFGQRIFLTSNPADNHIDVLNQELAESYPGTFRTEDTDLGGMLENIIAMAREGRAENLTLPEMMQRVEGETGWSVDDQIDYMARRFDAEIDKAMYAAGIEVQQKARGAMRLAREQERRREVVQRQAEQRQLREQQQRTMKALQWLKRNRNKAPEDLKARYDEVLADINLYTISAADEMRWSERHQATYGDLAQMYKDAQKNDPNWLPSKELDALISKLDGKAIADMDPDALDTLYKAAVALRTEFYNRNNVINDELHRTFAEVYDGSTEEIRNSDGRGSLGKGLAKLTNAEMMTPMNVLNMMGGWKKNGQFYSMARQLQAGERRMKGYVTESRAMLEEFNREYADWIRRADGQGKDAIWYELEVPELLELHMGDKPIFGSGVKVYMTPMQKVQLYLESKNYQNLQHMTGGRTFVNKELYSRGERSEALAQGTTVRLAPESVKKIVSDLTAEEQVLATLLERYYNEKAKGDINRVSNTLYGYDKAMIDYYAPIFTDQNYNKSTAGIFDVTAEGVGHLKSREQVSKNPSYNLSAIDAFERHVDQTSRFVGLSIPIRNMETLMNWYGDGETMKKVVSGKWGKEGVDYITDLMTRLQSPQSQPESFLQKLGDEAVSNYITAVFGANPGIVFKQAASYPAAAAVLGFGNIPSVRQMQATDEALINRYTPELAYRKLGYATPEIVQMRNNPSWMDRNPVTRFAFRGGAIQWMDVTTVKNLWAWAENYVRKSQPELETGTQEMIDAGQSPFYRAVADAFNEAVNITQPMYDTMNRAQIMNDKNALVRTLTLFKTVPMQEYNTLRKYLAEAKNGDKAAKRQAAESVASILASTLMLEAIDAAFDWVKNGLKGYRDDDDKLTAASFARQFGMDIAGYLAGMMIGGSELFEWITNKMLGSRRSSSDFQIVGAEQINELKDAIESGAGRLWETIGGVWNVAQSGGDVGQYLKRNGGNIASGVHELASSLAKYLDGYPVENIEKYLGGMLAKVWPEGKAFLASLTDTTTKKDLDYIDERELPSRLDDLLAIRGIDADEDTSAELARLYQAGHKAAVPSDTPDELDDQSLTAYEMQTFDNAYSAAIGESLDRLVESEAYIRSDDEGRADMLAALYKYATEIAKQAVDPERELSSDAQKIQEAGENSVDLPTYIAAKQAMKEADAANDGNGSITQAEAETALREMDLTNDQRAVLWQLTNKSWKEDNNPFSGGVDIQEPEAASTPETTVSEPAPVEQEKPDPTDRKYLRSLYEDLTPPEGRSEVTKTQKYRAIVNAFDSASDQVAALETEMSDGELLKIQIGRSRSVTPEMYIESKERMYAIDDAGDNNDSTSMNEAVLAINDMDLSTEQKAVLWQLTNKSWKGEKNPYDAAVGQEVYDELNGGSLQNEIKDEEDTGRQGLRLPTADNPNPNAITDLPGLTLPGM